MEPQFIKCGANIKLKILSFGPKKKIFSLLNIITLKLWFYHNYHKKSGMRSPGSMHDTGCLGLVYWDDPEGWYGEGGGWGVQDGEHMCTHGGFMLMCGRTNTIL